MIPLVQLKQNLEFNDSLRGIIDVFKVAAAMQLRQLQNAALLHEPFEQNVFKGFRDLDVRGLRHPFLIHQAKRPTCVVVVTSDEGFAGELNGLLIDVALNSRSLERHDELMVLGERGSARLEELNQPFIGFPGIGEEVRRDHVARLRRYLVREYLRGTYGRIHIVYAKYVSVTSQLIEEELLLPCRSLFGAEPADDSRRGFVEPSTDRVMEALVKLWLDFALGKIFLSSKLSEVSARVMHLDGSEQELTRANQHLELQVVKHEHAMADKAIREISTSRKVAR